jgi:hypothetical protein
MYDTTIRHYRHVFRNTLSPFHEEWKVEKHSETLGHDQALINYFERLKTAEEKHCELFTATYPSLTDVDLAAIDKMLDEDDDALYLKIFLHQQDRKGRSPAQAFGIR